MELSIDKNSSVAPFDQVRTQLTQQIGNGTLPPGYRLPTVRQLATDLGLAANTVAKAYRELESQRLIETRGRQGSFVPETASSIELAAREATVAYLTSMRSLGMTPAEVAEYIKRMYTDSQPGNPSAQAH